MTLKIVDCLSMSTIRRRCVTITAVCVHVHMSDNREPLCDAEESWLPVDALLRDDVSDDWKWLCDEKRYLRAFSHER